MTIVEALKKFYEGNAHDEQELKEADSVLDAIRAKYGPYEGANIAEYLQTAMANGVTPGSGGGGGSSYPTVTVTGDLEDPSSVAISCDWTFEEVATAVTQSGSSIAGVLRLDGEAFSVGGTWTFDFGEEYLVFVGSYSDPISYYSDGTLSYGEK